MSVPETLSYASAEPHEADLPLTDHPVAALFPMMSDDAYALLVQDIRQHDQREPIWIIGTQIIDGRNRYKACQEIGIAPLVREYTGPQDTATLVQFVLSLNLHRRHLSSSQLAVVALEVESMLAVEAKERQRAAGRFEGRNGDGTPRLSSSQRAIQALEVESAIRQALDPDLQVPQLIAEPEDEDELLPFEPAPRELRESRIQAAAIVGTNRQYVSDAKRIQSEAPDLLDKVRSGATTIPEAKRELKERKREVVREANRALVQQAPPLVTPSLSEAPKQYQTLVLDPPWDWGDEGDQDQFGRARPTYHTMSIEEITALPVGSLAQPNAHLYLWITNRSLPKGFALLDAWGFRYVTMITWAKPHFGMGNYFRGQTEHVLFGVRGSLPLLRNDVGTLFSAPRGDRHSSKPGVFYDLVESCSPGPWLELFARTSRPGWASWGAEVSA